MDKKPENIGDLGEFFNIIGKAKKQKEDEFSLSRWRYKS